jgi:hypothetical protein
LLDAVERRIVGKVTAKDHPLPMVTGGGRKVGREDQGRIAMWLSEEPIMGMEIAS